MGDSKSSSHSDAASPSRSDVGRNSSEGDGGPRSRPPIADRLRAVAVAAPRVIAADSYAALLNVLEETCEAVLPFDTLSMLIYDAEARALHELDDTVEGRAPATDGVSPAGTPVERVIVEQRSLLTDGTDYVTAQPAAPNDAELRPPSMIFSPVVADDEVLAVLCAASDAPDTYGPEDVEMVEFVASLAAAALSALLREGAWNTRDKRERPAASHRAQLAERTRQLDQAEQRFRAIVEASPTPLLFSRVDDGTILYANERLEKLHGLAPGSLAGQRTLDFYYDPADRQRVLEAIERDGFIRDMELRIRRPDGTPRWASISVQNLDYEGTPALATALVDITERKEAEKALRASEATYRGLFDSLAELVYIQDLEGRFVSVNDAVLRAYNYTRDEMIGQTPDLLAAPGRVDLQATMQRFRKAVAGEPQRFDWWGRRKDGSIFPKEVVLKRTTYFGQDVVIAVARDISDRVEAEAALRRSEEHFRRLIENASDLISILDERGTIRYESPSIRQMLGYEPDEMVGQNALDYIAPEDVPRTLKRLQQVVEQPGTPVSAEFRFRHRNGGWRFIEAVGTTLSPDSAAEGVVVNSRDITERKRDEAALRLQKTLLEAQGEASIDGILVVDDDGEILSYNRRFVEMWEIPSDVVATRSDEAAIQAVLDKLQNPDAFVARIEHLYAHPDEMRRDEITLKDGRVFDRYTAPVKSQEGDYYGRIWFFRDITAQKRHAAELEEARRDAEDARVQASHYARELERELEAGRQIQQSFLPAKLPCPPGWQIAARFRPAWRVAGDFYDVFELPGGRLGLVVADVSGKGVGAALFMALFQSLIRTHAERASLTRAHAAPSSSTIVAGTMAATSGYITRFHRPAHMFASVFFGLLDPETGELQYVNAGHEPPVVLGPEGPRARLAPTGPALGLMPDASFTTGHATLAPGELLLAFTDGATEARNPERDFFTEERLLEVCAEPVPTPAALLDRIENALHDFAGVAARSDDLTLLSVRNAGA